MVKVTFIEQDGTRREIEAKEGDPLMYSAKDAGIAGIIAECGGSAMCATCHCYLLEAPNGPLPEMEPAEEDTIEFTANAPTERSRLTCQIVVDARCEDAVFEVATGR
ncbi:2Fe-2S iron-sulfur cluster-binding protein [Maritimibacter sp. DP1N21-5]|uniref:2Fe-2S iron-sulfur cluster-binding protein n=1 Tax=Maritimibacter sp. DP1N21-5 TaxID=2836867 RepID=UPI001C45AE87|nr:2Fe-2S iron-sulfur cluster-binding protein [Maritimibacter sp. DP1N21-5]MBV7410667.1 (2Fe-2S)-binding protein [Maritimibacter sp. DP1N21-5]